MNLSTLTRSLSAFALAGSFCLSPAQTKKTWTDAEVMKIHKDAYLVDLHNAGVAVLSDDHQYLIGLDPVVGSSSRKHGSQSNPRTACCHRAE